MVKEKFTDCSKPIRLKGTRNPRVVQRLKLLRRFLKLVLDRHKERDDDEPVVTIVAYWHPDLGLMLDEVNLGTIHHGTSDEQTAQSGVSYSRYNLWYRSAEVLLACENLLEAVDPDKSSVDNLLGPSEAARELESVLFPEGKPSDFEIPF